MEVPEARCIIPVTTCSCDMLVQKPKTVVNDLNAHNMTEGQEIHPEDALPDRSRKNQSPRRKKPPHRADRRMKNPALELSDSQTEITAQRWH